MRLPDETKDNIWMLIALLIILGLLFIVLEVAPREWAPEGLILYIAFGLIYPIWHLLGDLSKWLFKKSRILPSEPEPVTHPATEKLEDFFLYIRPSPKFLGSNIVIGFTLSTMREVHSSNPTRLKTTDYKVKYINLEYELARALKPYALIAIGREYKYDPREIGRETATITDEEKSQFLDLTPRAIAIFIVPSTNQGTQWQLDRLADDEVLRKKTLLIIPPQVVLYAPDSNLHSDMTRQAALRALTDRGISLQYTDSSLGLLMRYDSPAIMGVPICTKPGPGGLFQLFLELDGWFFDSGGGTYKDVLKLELRNAILSLLPGLAELQK